MSGTSGTQPQSHGWHAASTEAQGLTESKPGNGPVSPAALARARRAGLAARRATSDVTRQLRALAVSKDHDWTRCLTNGARWADQRCQEIGACHGGPSAGVRALLGDEALLRALSQWCAGRVAQGDVEMLRVIPAAITGARGCARDAWEIAAREGQAMLDRVGDQSEGLSRLMARDVPTAELVQTEGTDRPADRVPPEGGGG